MNGIENELRARVADHSAVLGVVGLGYVGLPLAVQMARSGYRTIGFDRSSRVADAVNAGRSHIGDVSSDVLAAWVGEGLLSATSDMGRLGECDAISICVPTPLSKTKDPDLSYVVSAAQAVRQTLRRGQLIVLESTTYPGTTREALLPMFEETGLRAGEDFFLCFSPERVDPGNREWQTKNTPKVIGGVTDGCTELGMHLYGQIFDRLVPVESADAAELVKLYENTFRMINIALVNELAQVCERLNVDVWNVIDAAATKPFGFMKFTPGPGLGGHCIPLDPHYLSWKMKSLAYRTRMIELASEINGEMPGYVVRKITDALNEDGKAVNGSRILIIGVAYKKDIDDMRESPALEIMRLLEEKGAALSFHDPHCREIHEPIFPNDTVPRRSVDLDAATVASADAVVIVTDHGSVDYRLLADHATVIVDARGAMHGVTGRARIIGLSGTERRPPAVSANGRPAPAFAAGPAGRERSA